MKQTGRWNESGWIGNPMEYTFVNGSRIQFKSFESEGKAKASGKRDILFINEANHVPFPIADALMIRSKETYIDYNPDQRFWAHTELMDEHNSEFLVLTYEDNEALPAETLEDLLIKRSKAFVDPNGDLQDPDNVISSHWANWWRVYGLGLTGKVEGLILTGWETIKHVPGDARALGWGLDFGYTNDPTAMVSAYHYNGFPIFHEEFYRKGLTNPKIADLIKETQLQHLSGIADSAEPKSISEIRENGVNIRGVKKGADSIKFGIDVLQENKFYVTETSLNLIRELRSYMWEKEKGTNEFINKPANGQEDHAIDAIRYFAMENLSKTANQSIFAPTN